MTSIEYQKKIEELEKKIGKANELNQQQLDLILFLQRQIRGYETMDRAKHNYINKQAIALWLMC